MRRPSGRGIAAVPCLLAGGLASVAALAGLQLGQTGFTVLVATAVVLTFARARGRTAERSTWWLVGATTALNALCEVASGWSRTLDSRTWDVISVAAGGLVVPLAIGALALLLRERVGRLRAVAALDGLTAALVIQTLIALALLGPVEHALAEQGFSATVTLLYPLADLLVLGVVGAAAAQHGWRPDSWSWLLAGLVAITVGDSTQVADVVRSTAHAGGGANAAWLLGAWLIAVAAWARVPPRTAEAQSRNWVPVLFSVLALALLIVTATRAAQYPLALVLAGAAMATVLARFALTLRANAQMLLDARQEALTDALTGLPNRRRLTLDLEASIRSCGDRSCAVALYDLNGFKDYNDTYGHAAGDALLVTLGERLRTAVAGRAVAYRMGGDEFCVLVDCATQDAPAVATGAASALDLRTQGFAVSAAHGVVLLPTEARNASDALRLADMRMYEDKERRRMGPRRQAARALMGALAERDAALNEHLEGVESLATEVAERLGLPEAEIERVRLGALLHDVGKIAVPDAILHKPGPLSPAEWTLMHRHTLVGQRILERAPALADVAQLVRSSHERVDGGGYPDGLTGTAIPIGARIIAVCDAYDAMTATRSYRAALGAEQALAELRRCAGVQFDAEVVELFAAAVRQRAETDSTGGSLVAASNHVAPASAVPNTSPDVAPK
jgi:diguanylate cyclase (GGDEF)-like protein/putative nucleotidyltransferase with HDIG domain